MLLRIKDKFGSVLAFVLIVILVMTFVTFSIASLSSKNLDNVVGQYWEDRARYGAFSGVQRALTELALDEDFDAPGTAYEDVPLEEDPEVTWTIQVVNRVGESGTWAPDKKTWIPEGCVFIHSVGNLGSVANSSVSSMVAIVAPHRPTFDHALFARNKLTLDRCRTNSWHPAEHGEKKAHVSSNSVAANTITLDNSVVDGDAIAGVDPSEPNAAFNIINGSVIRGKKRWADESKPITEYKSPIARSSSLSGGIDDNATLTPGDGPIATIATILTGPNQGQDFSNKVIVLDGGGDYFIQGSLMMNGGRLDVRNASVTNPVTLYVEGNIALTGDVKVNCDSSDEAQNPRLLQIYTTDTPTNDESKMYLNSKHLSFVAAGETLDVTMFGSDFYGSIIAEDIRAQQSGVYYDVRLTGVPMDGRGGFKILHTSVETKGEAERALANSTTTNPGPNPTTPPANTTAPPPAPPPTAPALPGSPPAPPPTTPPPAGNPPPLVP